jgi:hypothetical protein
MAYVIFRGLNGRRQEADFGDEPIDVEIHANEDVVEICIELTGDRWHFGKKPFALLSVPSQAFPPFSAGFAPVSLKFLATSAHPTKRRP